MMFGIIIIFIIVYYYFYIIIYYYYYYYLENVFGPAGGSSLYSRSAQHVLQLTPSSPTQTLG